MMNNDITPFTTLIDAYADAHDTDTITLILDSLEHDDDAHPALTRLIDAMTAPMLLDLLAAYEICPLHHQHIEICADDDERDCIAFR